MKFRRGEAGLNNGMWNLFGRLSRGSILVVIINEGWYIQQLTLAGYYVGTKSQVVGCLYPVEVAMQQKAVLL